MTLPAYGVGIGWRPEIAGFVADLPGLRFVEVVAESLPHDGPAHVTIHRLRVDTTGVTAAEIPSPEPPQPEPVPEPEPPAPEPPQPDPNPLPI